jgi:hypothetical protein
MAALRWLGWYVTGFATTAVITLLLPVGTAAAAEPGAGPTPAFGRLSLWLALVGGLVLAQVMRTRRERGRRRTG